MNQAINTPCHNCQNPQANEWVAPQNEDGNALHEGECLECGAKWEYIKDRFGALHEFIFTNEGK